LFERIDKKVVQEEESHLLNMKHRMIQTRNNAIKAGKEWEECIIRTTNGHILVFQTRHYILHIVCHTVCTVIKCTSARIF